MSENPENKEIEGQENSQPEQNKGQNTEEKVVQRVVEDEMKSSYLDYSMSVIVGRALPDVRDGLKPVHRRILFAMHSMGMMHNKPFKKSARIVGEVLGKYHPHGDTAVYDSMVRMAQDFSLRYTLVDGQGNFGSIDGDNAAAMRYTEARLSRIAEEMLVDIDKDTVDFVPNFDNSLKEPSVLPSKIPNLLINGSSGIAVGMATTIPPHNMTEVIDGTIRVIDNPDVTAMDLVENVKGPDFPTGGIIYGTGGILSAYSKGKGKVLVRARTNVEEMKNKQRIIVSEIPFMVNKAHLIEQIADLVRDKKIQGISDLRDESDREGMRIVIELRQDANPDIVLNQLYKHTRMQETVGMILLALVDGEPKVLNLKEIIQNFIDHRKEVVRRRTKYELVKAEERAHILEGIIIALNDIDNAIQLIKQSKSTVEARDGLIAKYELSEKQAMAILDMKLQKLTNLEQDKIKEEHKGLLELIEELKAILASEQKILEIIKKELEDMKEKYGDERKTQIMEGGQDVEIDFEDLIEEEKMVVTVTHAGYVKRVPMNTYKLQARGGKGVIATGTKEEDFVEEIFVASTHSYILVFTDKGNVHWLKVYNIPEGSRQAKGRPIVNLVELDKEESVTAFIPVKEFDEEHFLMLATKQGIIKKTPLSNFKKPRRGGIRAITLDEGDDLITAKLTDGSRHIVLATENGMAIRFDEKDVRPIGRTGKGVKGINLKGKDAVIGMDIATDKKRLLTITENGYGKQTSMAEYRVIGRGGVGVINIQCSERNGKVVEVKAVYPDNEIIFMSRQGIVIRTRVDGISKIGRNTQGVRLMKMGGDDKVAAAAKIVVESEDELNKAIKKEETGEENGNGHDEELQPEVKEEQPVEDSKQEEIQPEEPVEEKKEEEPRKEVEEKEPVQEASSEEVKEKPAEEDKEEDFNPKPTPDYVPSIDELRKKAMKRR